VLQGRWRDSPDDSAYVGPTRQQLYDQLDRFHIPSRPDSAWGEWHYFNLVTSAEEWWYLTFLVGGDVPRGQWGGRILVTHRRRDGGYERFTADAPSGRVSFDTARADLTIGRSSVRQRDGSYALVARARGPDGALSMDLLVRPLPNRYFPAVELRDQEFVSGYVVPALAASASGRICLGGHCSTVREVPAYHDHNWGVWRDVTWEWGAARGRRLSLLYGGVYGPERTGAARGTQVSSPFFLTLVDSLGVRQVLRFDRIDYQGRRRAAGIAGSTAPERFRLRAARGADTVQLQVEVDHALASEMEATSFRRYFLQMRGRFRLEGKLAGESIADSGSGFFETYRRH
jgi:hypothetical protein